MALRQEWIERKGARRMSAGLGIRTALALAVGAVIGGWSVAGSAAGTGSTVDLHKEIEAAIEHATYAADGKTLSEAHMHLHHVINCLVGPDGQAFDAKALNPCKSLGNGILPDTTGASQKKEFEAALAKAEAGLGSKQMKTAKADAAEVASMLKKDTM